MTYHCGRCDRTFDKEFSYEQHLNDSSRYWRCTDEGCGFDGYTRAQLPNHYGTSECRQRSPYSQDSPCRQDSPCYQDRNNGIVQYPNEVIEGQWKCPDCGAKFSIGTDLFVHIRYDRCHLVYFDYDDEIDSSENWDCMECGEYGYTQEGFLDHLREHGCKKFCQGCNDGRIELWEPDSTRYWQHVSSFNVCTDCSRHHDRPQDLFKHMLSHVPAENYSCLKCDENFPAYGDMILHLESGGCNYANRRHLDQVGASFPKSSKFLYEHFRYRILMKDDVEHMYEEVEFYFCPTCKMSLFGLSDLFEHVESLVCRQTMDDGIIKTLVEYLAVRV